MIRTKITKEEAEQMLEDLKRIGVIVQCYPSERKTVWH
jgi:hypothetical protein